MKGSVQRFTNALFATACLAAATTPLLAANVLMVREKVTLNGSAADVWAKIGGFCAIADWHPAVTACEQSDDTTRILTLADGGTMIETKTKDSKMSYKYTIAEGPLPVDNYKASFKLKDKKDGTSQLIWSASFSPQGVSEDEAKAVIQSVFDAGISTLQSQFK